MHWLGFTSLTWLSRIEQCKWLRRPFRDKRNLTLGLGIHSSTQFVRLFLIFNLYIFYLISSNILAISFDIISFKWYKWYIGDILSFIVFILAHWCPPDFYIDERKRKKHDGTRKIIFRKSLVIVTSSCIYVRRFFPASLVLTVALPFIRPRIAQRQQ